MPQWSKKISLAISVIGKLCTKCPNPDYKIGYSRTQSLHELQGQLDALHSRVQKFLSELGSQTGRRLQDMYRSRSTQVVVTAVRLREYEEHDRVKKERSAFQHRLGTLNGLAVVARESYTPIYIAITNILGAFEAAASARHHRRQGRRESMVE